MPTVTPTRRPGLQAALERRLAAWHDLPLLFAGWPAAVTLCTVLVGVVGAGLTIRLAA